MDAREKILKAKYIGPCLTKKMSGQVCGRPCIGEICHKCLFNVGSQGTNAKAKTKAKEKAKARAKRLKALNESKKAKKKEKK